MNFKKWPVVGILSLALSVLIFVNPKDIAKSLMITLRLVVLVPGITLVANALRLIKIQRQDQLVTIDPAGQSKCVGTPR